MSDDSSLKSIRVHILGREYALRVHESDEAHTRKMAAFVNARMEQFKDDHPEQSELTTAVITALMLSEELHLVRDQHEEEQDAVDGTLSHLTARLSHAIEAG